MVLISDNIYFLQNILSTSLSYCQKYHVTLATEKTKLVAFHLKKHGDYISYIDNLDLLKIDGIPVKFSDSAQHVGVRRSINGNLPHLLDRLAARKKTLFSILPAGLALKNNGNIAAALHLDKIFAIPVMLSGLNSLVLNRKETS